MQLHGAQHGLAVHLGGRHLHTGDLLASGVPTDLINPPCRVQHLQPELGEFDP